MAVKAVVKRVPRQGRWKEMNEVLHDLRIQAMRQAGYMYGETLVSAERQGGHAGHIGLGASERLDRLQGLPPAKGASGAPAAYAGGVAQDRDMGRVSGHRVAGSRAGQLLRDT